jgi:hypothetical protein
VIRRAYTERLIALALALLTVVFAPIERPWTAPLVILLPLTLVTESLDGQRAVFGIIESLDSQQAVFDALVLAALMLALLLVAINMIESEERLNARGETLFPSRKRFDRRAIRARTDAALLAAVRGLVAGGEVLEVLGRLEAATHRGDAMPPGRARECYDAGVGALERAAGTCRVLEWDERQRLVRRATRWLFLARVALREQSRSRR